MRTFLVPTYKSKAVEATASSITLESRPQYSHATLNGCAANIFRACHHFCLERFRTYSWCRFPLTTSPSLITKARPPKKDTPRAITIWFENIDLMVVFANVISVAFYFSPPLLLYARSADSQHYFSSTYSVSLFSPHPKTCHYFQLLFFINIKSC